MPAPIILFVYCRPTHTSLLLESLSINEEARDSLLYVYCDGAKESASESDLRNIQETRTIVKNEKRFLQLEIIEQEKNKGLANSIIDGVTAVMDLHGKAIVLEDDLVVSPYFLHYMNESLDRYEKDERVGQIGACNFFACGKKYPETFFLPIPDCWGWATWKNRWQAFNPNASELIEKLKNNQLTDKFNVYGTYNMMGMLKEQVEGKVSSWAIRWQAVCVLNNWMALYPNPSVTHHIESADATHANINVTPPLMAKEPMLKKVDVVEIPAVIDAMKKGYAGTGDYYGKSLGPVKSGVKKTLVCILRKIKRKLVN